MRGIRAVGLVCVLVLAAACASSGGEQSQRVEVAPSGVKPLVGPKSVVQLGDSIASGEGTLYGYTYDAKTKEWTGGDVNATWPPPYPECHVSPDAYGNKVASAFGASFHQFACTGASFDVGIAGPMVVGRTTRRPAEFGNWDTQANLNAEYDTANPDLVLVTLGADDVDFSDIVEECVKNSYKHYWYRATLECVDGNPGSTVQKDFFDYLPTLKKSYATLVDWIEKRAKAHDVPVPKIVFTNYANPLPDAKVECNDTSYLYDEQVQYLGKLLAQMNDVIASTLAGLKKDNVALADISRAYQPAGVDHRWCSDDPWAYGLSIYQFAHPSSFYSLAPFHPTPAGQEHIAEGVIATVANLFQADIPVDTTTTSAGDTTTTSTSTTLPPTTTTDPTPPSTDPTPPSTDPTPPTDPDPGPDPDPDGG